MLKLRVQLANGDGKCMYSSLLDAMTSGPRAPAFTYVLSELPVLAVKVATEWIKGAWAGVEGEALDVQRKFLDIFSPEDRGEDRVREKLRRRARPVNDPGTWGGEWSCMCLAHHLRCHIVVVVHRNANEVSEVQIIDSTNFTDKAPFPPAGQLYAGRRAVTSIDEVFDLLDKSISGPAEEQRNVHFLRLTLNRAHYDALAMKRAWTGQRSAADDPVQ